MPQLRRAVLLVCMLAALAAAGVLFSLGDPRGAIAAAVVAASCVIFLACATHPSPWHWLVIGLLGGTFLLLGLPIIVVAGAAIALVILQLVVNVVSARKVGQITLERLAEPAVMPGADELVRQFSAEGFHVIGGFRFQIVARPVILTVMIGPDRTRLAVVTDKVWQVVSRFGTRSLLTANSALAPLPADVLRQHVADGSPTGIVRAHDAALTILDRRSLRPDVFASETEALDATQQLEERSIAFIRQASLTTAMRMETAGASGAKLLRDDPHSLRRINAWLGA